MRIFAEGEELALYLSHAEAQALALEGRLRPLTLEELARLRERLRRVEYVIEEGKEIGDA